MARRITEYLEIDLDASAGSASVAVTIWATRVTPTRRAA